MILVTGGAGFVGRHLVSALALRGVTEVRVLSRSPERLFGDAERSIAVALDAVARLAAAGRMSAEDLAGARARAARGPALLLREVVRPIAADIRDAAALRRALGGVETVLHTVAIIRETEGRTFQDTNVEAVRALVSAMQETGVQRLVHMGILGAVDDPRLPYARSRWLGERAVLESGLDYTVVKPSLVLGVADAFSLRLLRALDFSRPIVALPDGGHTRFQPLWIGDLVAALVLCLEDAQAHKRFYEPVGPEHVAFSDLMRRFARRLGKRRLYVPVPIGLLLPGAAILSGLWRDPPATPAELRQLRVDDITALDAFPRAFGFQPLALEDYIDYIRDIATARRRTREV